MKHLVTGSKGFLGQHLMRALGDDAVGVDNDSDDLVQEIRGGRGVANYCDIMQSYCEREDPCSLLVTGDHVRTFIWKTLRQNHPDTVWHLAALNDATQTFYDRPWDVLNTQIRGTLNVIDACVANGVKTLVLFSSSEVYQTPPVIPTPEDVPLVVPDLKNPRYSYGGGKIAAELLAWWSAIPRVIIIRPHNVYGPGQKEGHLVPDLIRAVAEAEHGGVVTVRGPRDASRALCYVDDFVSDCLEVVRRDGMTREVYHLGNDEESTVEHVAEVVSITMGRSDVEFTFGDAQPGSTHRRCPDLSKVRALGWTPGASLASGIDRTIAWYREQKK